MNSKVTACIGFATGAVSGIFIGIQLVKSKFNKQAQEDHDELRAYYEEKLRAHTQTCEAASPVEDEPETVPETKQNTYRAMTRDMGYAPEKDMSSVPYVISPDEFGEMDEYTQISLTYYSDGILTDDNKEVVDNPVEIVGDGLNHFGEYEDDAVFVRNDKTKCDYEILMVEDTYN